MSIIPKCPICWGKCGPGQCETKQQPDALRLADAIDPFVRQSAPDHLTSKVAADELRRLHQHELALKEWLDKTEWVQETHEAYELGMHRADALKRRIDRLVNTLAETHGAYQAKLLHDEALLRQALAALEIGRDYAFETAQQFHIEMRGYKQQRHDAMDADVKRIDDAIAALKERLT